MRLPKYFRARRPKHVATTPTLPVAELLITRWHGLTPEQWNDLPALVKVDHREAYFRAWGLAE